MLWILPWSGSSTVLLASQDREKPLWLNKPIEQGSCLALWGRPVPFANMSNHASNDFPNIASSSQAVTSPTRCVCVCVAFSGKAFQIFLFYYGSVLAVTWCLRAYLWKVNVKHDVHSAVSFQVLILLKGFKEMFMVFHSQPFLWYFWESVHLSICQFWSNNQCSGLDKKWLLEGSGVEELAPDEVGFRELIGPWGLSQSQRTRTIVDSQLDVLIGNSRS